MFWKSLSKKTTKLAKTTNFVFLEDTFAKPEKLSLALSLALAGINYIISKKMPRTFTFFKLFVNLAALSFVALCMFYFVFLCGKHGGGGGNKTATVTENTAAAAAGDDGVVVFPTPSSSSVAMERSIGERDG